MECNTQLQVFFLSLFVLSIQQFLYGVQYTVASVFSFVMCAFNSTVFIWSAIHSCKCFFFRYVCFQFNSFYMECNTQLQVFFSSVICAFNSTVFIWSAIHSCECFFFRYLCFQFNSFYMECNTQLQVFFLSLFVISIQQFLYGVQYTVANVFSFVICAFNSPVFKRF